MKKNGFSSPYIQHGMWFIFMEFIILKALEFIGHFLITMKLRSLSLSDESEKDSREEVTCLELKVKS